VKFSAAVYRTLTRLAERPRVGVSFLAGENEAAGSVFIAKNKSLLTCESSENERRNEIDYPAFSHRPFLSSPMTSFFSPRDWPFESNESVF